MTVKSTGQKIEVEGGEGIVNKYAMCNTDTFQFEGKEKTSCEIISDLNQKKGDGVSFECDTVENKKYKFKKGGKLNFTTSEDFYSRMEKTIKEAYEFLNQYEYKRSRYDSPKLAVNVKLYNVNYDIDEALETYQNRKGNFDMDKMRYVKKDLYLDEQWVYEQYNRFLDDTLYFFKEELLEDFGDVLKDKQIYQEGRSGGWLVFNDDGELSEMVDELESILNNNFAEDGELVGNDRWGYDMEPVTFKEFKEEGEYDDAIYYAERIKYLLTDYEDIVEHIKKTHKDVPANWKAFLDEKVDEHISEDKKRYKIFTEDDPDFSKGGKPSGYLFGMGNKHKYASNEQLVERIENLRVKMRGNPDINIDNEMSELLSRQEAQGFKVVDDDYGLRIHYNSNEARKKSQSLYYAKGGKTKLEMDVFVQLQEENKKEIRYLMIGKQGKKGFSGLIMDYVGGGQFQEFYFADGIDIESELYDQTDGDYDNEEVEDVFIDKKGKDFYNLIHETMDDLVDFGDDYQPILQKNPPKNKLAYNTGDITPITVGMTIFEDESKGKYAKGGKIKNEGYFVAIDRGGNALTLFQSDSGS